MSGFARHAVIAAAVLALDACAATGPLTISQPALPPPPVHPHGQVLWSIVHGQCTPDQAEHGDPSPCALVSLAGGEARGFAVLKDQTGVAQHLLIPTGKVTGIEDPKLLAPDAPDYFADAWATRRFTEARLGGAVPREDLSVAVNSIYGRSQDQLHLHVDCLAFSARDALRADAAQITGAWSARTFQVGDHAYRVRRIDRDSLAGVDPFHMLADGVPGASREMGAWTLVLAGAVLPDGRPGFYLLADRADPAHGDSGSGEVLQDHDCKDLRATAKP